MELLRRFNDDRATKEALREYLEMFIGDEAVKMVYERKDVAHIADAKDLLDKAFSQLEIDYGIQPKYENTENRAK